MFLLFFHLENKEKKLRETIVYRIEQNKKMKKKTIDDDMK